MRPRVVSLPGPVAALAPEAAELSPPRLFSHTAPLDDPRPLLDFLPPSDAYAWVRDGEGLAGWGEVVRYKATSISDAQQWWRELAGTVVSRTELPDPPAGAGFVAFGSFAFDPTNTAAHSTLVVPRVVVGRRHGQTWLTTIGTEQEVATDDGTPALPRQPKRQSPGQVTIMTGGLTADAWAGAVSEAVRRINGGALDKVVLARDLIATSEHDLDLRWVVARLAGRYPDCWSYLVDGLVGSTPEMLISREHGRVTSRVLAGTIPRSGDADHDRVLADGLARSGKDLEEHEYAVASVARALAPFCTGLTVPEVPYVLDLPNVRHLATDVTATAAPDADVLALAAALHPSAAVCGTPTDVARETIAELEHLDRQRYSGPVGWIDADGNGEWGLALRSGIVSETDPREIRLYAGCGIVAGSDPQAELAEAAAKLLPMREALQT